MKKVVIRAYIKNIRVVWCVMCVLIRRVFITSLV